MMVMAATFHGTHREGLQLLAAVERNCQCKKMLGMVQGPLCPPHLMLQNDQRALDGLLDARQRAAGLWQQEMSSGKERE